MRGRITPVERSVNEWRDGVPGFGTTKTGKVRTVELALELPNSSPRIWPPLRIRQAPTRSCSRSSTAAPFGMSRGIAPATGPRCARCLPSIGTGVSSTLRHSYATMLLSAGVNPAWVAKQGGWASTKILLDTYGRALPEDDERGRGVLSAAFQSGTAPNVVTF